MRSSREQRLEDILLADPIRVTVLSEVQELELPESLVAAGFVRNAVWDSLHGHRRPTPLNDIDVIFYSPPQLDPNLEHVVARRLTERIPGQRFSVKNQARMHLRNEDPPYASALDSMANWPERCTAVGVALTGDGSLHIAAPFGLADLFDLVVRPTRPEMTKTVRDRAREKGWLSRWPRLTVRDAGPPL